MLYRSNVFRFLTSFLLITMLVSLGLADTIRLKDGSIIKGRIESFIGGKFVVAMGEGSRRKQLTFLASEIESIEFDAPISPPQFTTATNRNASYEEPVTIPNVQPKVVAPADSTKIIKPPPPANSRGEKMKPIEWQIKVLADNTANGWTNSGWVVKKGQRIRITGDGVVSLGKNQASTPSGLPSINDDSKLLQNVATGALIAVIGDDNNDFIYVGSEREFIATRDGALFLGINEGNLDDNSGAYNVKIEIIPDAEN